jgi:hypothetical protein
MPAYNPIELLEILLSVEYNLKDHGILADPEDELVLIIQNLSLNNFDVEIPAVGGELLGMLWIVLLSGE